MRILAISSAGGHWEQLVAIRECFQGHEVFYANTMPGLAGRPETGGVAFIHDCNRHAPLDTVRSVADAFRLVGRIRPDFVVTTGAGPGLLVLAVGKLFGARCVWIDSIANSEKLSLSGRLALKIADLHLTQWEHLASPDGPSFFGSVL
jgi:exopolysaccharide biosynthesis glucuronosyltransferase PssD